MKNHWQPNVQFCHRGSSKWGGIWLERAVLWFCIRCVWNCVVQIVNRVYSWKKKKTFSCRTRPETLNQSVIYIYIYCTLLNLWFIGATRRTCDDILFIFILNGLIKLEMFLPASMKYYTVYSHTLSHLYEHQTSLCPNSFRAIKTYLWEHQAIEPQQCLPFSPCSMIPSERQDWFRERLLCHPP